ncbi:hypothetical protein V3C99_006416 [Haemonchus contortus]
MSYQGNQYGGYQAYPHRPPMNPPIHGRPVIHGPPVVVIDNHHHGHHHHHHHHGLFHDLFHHHHHDAEANNFDGKHLENGQARIDSSSN